MREPSANSRQLAWAWGQTSWRGHGGRRAVILAPTGDKCRAGPFIWPQLCPKLLVLLYSYTAFGSRQTILGFNEQKTWGKH